jgi:hypothetical protein
MLDFAQSLNGSLGLVSFVSRAAIHILVTNFHRATSLSPLESGGEDVGRPRTSIQQRYSKKSVNERYPIPYISQQPPSTSAAQSHAVPAFEHPSTEENWCSLRLDPHERTVRNRDSIPQSADELNSDPTVQNQRLSTARGRRWGLCSVRYVL